MQSDFNLWIIFIGWENGTSKSEVVCTWDEVCERVIKYSDDEDIVILNVSEGEMVHV